MTVTVNITGLEPVSEAINNLAKAMGVPGGVTAAVQDRTTGPAPQIAPASAPQPVPVTSAQSAAPIQSVPVQQTAPVPGTVPTATPVYTEDVLAKAAMTLMDSGKQGDLINLLGQFGVNALPELPPGQYGAFATALRGMGAQI